MKKLFLLLLGLVLLADGHARKPVRVVMIALDGICVDGFIQANTPNLDALLKEGALSTDTRVVMPSVTLPNWTSHLTGSGPEQHGVFNNSWTLEKSKYPVPAKDNDGYYPSAFTVLKNEVPDVKTAFYYNWINLFYPHNRKYFDEVSYLKDDAYKPNYEKAFNFIVANRNFPTLVFLYSVHTDHAGHSHKWMSPEYIRSIEEGDAEIGRFLEKLKAEGLYEDTYFMFLTDHGGINYGHGGTTPQEMIVPWGIVGPKIRKNFKIEEPNNTVNTAAMVLKLFKVEKPLSWTGEVIESVFR